MDGSLAEAKRVLADPEIVLSRHEWIRLLAGLVAVIEAEPSDSTMRLALLDPAIAQRLLRDK